MRTGKRKLRLPSWLCKNLTVGKPKVVRPNRLPIASVQNHPCPAGRLSVCPTDICRRNAFRAKFSPRRQCWLSKSHQGECKNMKIKLGRLWIALTFALLAAGITLVVVSAQNDSTSPSQPFTQDCAVCHTDFQTTWESGAHGQAGSDPIFVNEWTKQGKPGACLVCHTTGYDPATAGFRPMR